MPKILVLYYSRTGNTKKMASLVKDGIVSEKVEADLKNVSDIVAKDLLNYECIVIGSPTYYGTMAAQIKELLDKSVAFHGRLSGKVGGAFASSANVGGGNETTVLDILNAMLIHGMIIQGSSDGDHYGPVSIGAPDKRAKKGCISYGKNLALLAKRLSK